MKWLWIAFGLLAFSWNAYADVNFPVHPSGYDNFEGILSPEHDQEMEENREKYFYTNGSLDLNKVREAQAYFRTKRDEFANSIYQYTYRLHVEKYHASHEQAEKAAKKSTGKTQTFLRAFSEVVGRLGALSSGSGDSPDKQRAEVENILVLIAQIETHHNVHWSYELVNSLKSYAQFFHEVPKTPEGPEASNLTANGYFLSPDEIGDLAAKNSDLSLLDPPNTAFWFNNRVEDYNPMDRKYLGHEIFPELGTPFHYRRTSSGSVK
ncbi:MAG: hypothetical protein KDD43_01285, partial [Bdellovibrionales bacterium]|nr:hypothetical protein [Bdellovibrionales bacterium]